MIFRILLYLPIFLLTFISLPPSQKLLGGTTIIVLGTPDVVIMAADSKQLQSTNDTANYVEVCKINKIGHYYYAIAGYYELTESSYNSVKILNESLSNSVTETLDNFIVNIKNPMDSALKIIKQTQPQLFQGLKGTNLMTLILSGFEKDSSDVKYVEFKLDSATGFSPEPIIKSLSRDKPQWVKIGESDSINNFLKKNPDYVSKNNPITFLTDLINMEAAHSPTKVGGPVDIVFITKDTSIWLQKKSICD